MYEFLAQNRLERHDQSAITLTTCTAAGAEDGAGWYLNFKIDIAIERIITDKKEFHIKNQWQKIY